MKELLEPIYLNEKMLLNCASYLFDGIELSKEIHQADENHSDKNLDIEGTAKTNGIVDLIAQADGKLNAGLITRNNSSLSSNSVKNITLGAIHMKALKKLYEEGLIHNFKNFEENLKKKPYISIEADLQPVDFFELLQILKMLTPQLKYFVALLNKKNTNNTNKRNPSAQQSLNNDLIEIIKNLIVELEKSYLESNLLEMLMFKDNKCIGVIDLDLDNIDPSKLKSQLNDGNFTVIGKITKNITSDERINLLQRNIITPLLTIVERITVFVETKKNLQNLEVLEDKISKLKELKDTVFSIINLLLDIYIEGPALRIRAMSVCI
ncbi:hypothetical protein [Acinetobacter sp. MB5]|uniref:DUF6414 family protein n=1 Tax=Acinetobacter sp. MB5 TaxID=2069438 RepID=UPI0013A6DC34|nr:hypothetical protein [Acinetobacter sp. MB5]